MVKKNKLPDLFSLPFLSFSFAFFFQLMMENYVYVLSYKNSKHIMPVSDV